MGTAWCNIPIFRRSQWTTLPGREKSWSRTDPLPIISIPSERLAEPYITLNGVKAEMFYSGLTPGVVGVFQMNFRIPEGTPDGDAILNAVTDTICRNQGTPQEQCIEGKKSLGANILVRGASPH
jgi:hypothetical protein